MFPYDVAFVAVTFGLLCWFGSLQSAAVRHDEDVRNLWRSVLETNKRLHALTMRLNLKWIEETTVHGHYENNEKKS